MTEPHDLMTPREVAARFRVDEKTPARWAKSGRIPGLKTPGGAWRFRRNEIEALLAGADWDEEA